MIPHNALLSYKFFYLLAFLANVMLLLFYGSKRGYPLRSLFLTMVTVTFFTIIGSRIVTIPFHEWGRAILSGDVDSYSNRSAIGGMIFGMMALLFTQWFFGFKRSILDLYAWVAPVGYGIQKLGCLMNGCCYGRPTSLPWGVHYTEGSQAHFHQWVSGMIGQDAVQSLAVHPVQLYESLMFFFIAFLVLKLRRRLKQQGSLLILTLILFFFLRYVIEFLRDPSGSGFMPGEFWGMRLLQWLLLGMGSIGVVALYLNEKSFFAKIKRHPDSSGTFFSPVILLLAVTLLFLSLRVLVLQV